MKSVHASFLFRGQDWGVIGIGFPTVTWTFCSSLSCAVVHHMQSLLQRWNVKLIWLKHTNIQFKFPFPVLLQVVYVLGTIQLPDVMGLLMKAPVHPQFKAHEKRAWLQNAQNISVCRECFKLIGVCVGLFCCNSRLEALPGSDTWHLSLLMQMDIKSLSSSSNHAYSLLCSCELDQHGRAAHEIFSHPNRKTPMKLDNSTSQWGKRYFCDRSPILQYGRG